MDEILSIQSFIPNRHSDIDYKKLEKQYLEFYKESNLPSLVAEFMLEKYPELLANVLENDAIDALNIMYDQSTGRCAISYDYGEELKLE